MLASDAHEFSVKKLWAEMADFLWHCEWPGEDGNCSYALKARSLVRARFAEIRAYPGR
jgi:hypothetical protein